VAGGRLTGGQVAAGCTRHLASRAAQVTPADHMSSGSR
jgi:hypothetical protein